MAKAPNPHMTKMTIIQPNGRTEHLQGHLTKQWTAGNLYGRPSMEITIQDYEMLEVPAEKKSLEQEREELLQKHSQEIGTRIRGLKKLRLSHEQERERMELDHAKAEQAQVNNIKQYVFDAWKGNITAQDLHAAQSPGHRDALAVIINSIKPDVLADLADIV